MKNFFKKEKKFKKEEESIWLDLNFSWRIAVALMFLGSLSAFWFGYYFFTKINEEPAASKVEGTFTETVQKEAIQKKLEYFSAREKKSAEILNSPSPIVDPSL